MAPHWIRRGQLTYRPFFVTFRVNLDRTKTSVTQEFVEVMKLLLLKYLGLLGLL